MRSQKRRRRSALAGKNTVSLGRRIRAARQSRGMTQHELARGACSISFVSMVEHDLVRPSLATLKVLAERLGKPLSHFLDDEAAPSAQVQLHHAEALLRQRRFAQAHEIFHEALQRLAAAGLQQTEVYGKLLANLGRVCVELGLPAQALDYLRQAAETLAAAADPFHLGLLYFHVGVAWERQHSFERAREFLQRAEELFAVHENIRLLGMVKRSLGMLHIEEGALAAAQEDLDASLRLAGQCGDDEGVAQTLVELARLRARAGDAGGALRAAEDAASLATRIGDEAELARARAALADALAVAGRRDEAAVRYQEAVAGFQALGMTGYLIRVCRDLGFLLMQQEKGEEAARWFALAFSHQSPTTVLSMDRAP